MEKRKSGVLTFVLIILLILATLSIAIACPILIRPFYYAHIEGLNLVNQTGFEKEVIKEAYDEVLDFCVFGKEFGTGALLWSEEGKSHFADCAKLFKLDFLIAVASVLGLILAGISAKVRGLAPTRPLRKGPSFWAGTTLIAFMAMAGVIFAINFDKAFTLFHKLFFPGKDNWIFDAAKDQIILVMPKEFFRNCGILILALVLIACITMIIIGLKGKEKRNYSREVGPGFKLY